MDERMQKGKKTYGWIALLFVMGQLAFSLVSCSDFHTSDNGRLDGRWQLTQTDTLANGRSEAMRARMIFWSVQSRLLKMEDLHDLNVNRCHVGIFFHFEQKDGRLRVYEPVADHREISDSIVTSVETLRFYGLEHLDETFNILQLEDSRMTLENKSLRMYFRKY